MYNIIKKDGFNFAFDTNSCFECQGNCCIGESGYVWVTPEEIKNISNFLNISEELFISTHLRKVSYRYSLKEREVDQSFECEFFDSTQKACKIYLVRPTQCRTFPFWDYFKENIEEVTKECPGIIKL
jgi:Fe-S-cluster containining protein